VPFTLGTFKREELNMTLDEFYKTYTLHRENSVGIQLPEGHPDYIKDDFTRKYTSGVDSYEEHVGEYIKIIEVNLNKDIELCGAVFKTLDMDFFFWFTTEYYEWFEDIISAHKNLELLENLKEHVYSFNNSLATERMDKIYNNCVSFCK
jgi:hypothetical protein